MNEEPPEKGLDTPPQPKDRRAVTSAAARQKSRLGEALRANLKRRKKKSVEGRSGTASRIRAENDG